MLAWLLPNVLEHLRDLGDPAPAEARQGRGCLRERPCPLSCQPGRGEDLQRVLGVLGVLWRPLVGLPLCWKQSTVSKRVRWLRKTRREESLAWGAEVADLHFWQGRTRLGLKLSPAPDIPCEHGECFPPSSRATGVFPTGGSLSDKAPQGVHCLDEPFWWSRAASRFGPAMLKKLTECLIV